MATSCWVHSAARLATAVLKWEMETSFVVKLLYVTIPKPCGRAGLRSGEGKRTMVKTTLISRSSKISNCKHVQDVEKVKVIVL